MTEEPGRQPDRIINGNGNVVYEGFNHSVAKRIWTKMLAASFERWYGGEGWKGWGRRPLLFGKLRRAESERLREEIERARRALREGY